MKWHIPFIRIEEREQQLASAKGIAKVSRGTDLDWRVGASYHRAESRELILADRGCATENKAKLFVKLPRQTRSADSDLARTA